MAKVVDARGLACPQPVTLTKKALEEADEVTVVVDNQASRDNVRRMAESQGCQVEVEEREDGIYLHLHKTADQAAQQRGPGGPVVLVISSEEMGRGSGELGAILMRAFLHTLGEVSTLPQRVIFYNTGVKLTVEGSEVLEDLRALEREGVEILVCGTCLGYFGLKDRIAVGQISNMYSITEAMLGASRLVVL